MRLLALINDATIHTMIDTILFDLWNTLAFMDDLPNKSASLKQSLGSEPWNYLTKLFIEAHRDKASSKSIVEAVSSKYRVSSEAKLLIAGWLDNQEVRLYPDTLILLRELRARSIKMGLVSNSPATGRKYLNLLGIDDYFEIIIFSCDCGYMKPEVEIFNIAINALNADTRATLMVGDSLTEDIIGAKNVGLSAVQIDRVRGNQETIKSLDQLVVLLDSE